MKIIVRQSICWAVAAALLLGILSPAAAMDAPDLTVTTLQGERLTLANLKGKVVLVNFFGSWCMPCRVEVPHLVKLHRKYQDRPFEILGLALEMPGTLDPLKRFVAGFQISYPVAAAGVKEAKLFGGVRGVPTSFLIDRRGRLVQRFIGYVSLDVLDRAIATLLTD